MENSNLKIRLNKNWFVIFNVLFLIFIGLPFLAPVLMKVDYFGPAKLIYGVYKFLCHQLPQRSFFLFGSKPMYSLAEIQAAWQNTSNPMILRQFIGDSEIGWKVAWSDRMVYMYAGILLFSWIWYPLRKQIKPLSSWGFAFLLLPMAVDGTSHFISDFWGIGQGFRDSNSWLSQLTGFSFQTTFYVGDAFGSFNSWMRLLSGITFGAAIALFGFPYIQEIFDDNLERLESKREALAALKNEAMREIMKIKENNPMDTPNPDEKVS